MNPKPILGLPDLEINSGSPRTDTGIAFFVFFFSVTHKIGLFSPKIEAIRIALRCRSTAAATTTAVTAAATAGCHASSAASASNSSSCRLLFSP
jgi:Mg2+/citrate symporter